MLGFNIVQNKKTLIEAEGVNEIVSCLATHLAINFYRGYEDLHPLSQASVSPNLEFTI